MLSSKIIIGFSVLIAAAAALSSAIAAEPESIDMPRIEREITLKDHAETWSQSVCLGDLVEETWLQSRCAIDHVTCCQWSLGGARTKTFSRGELDRAITRLDLTGIKLTTRGAEQVTVTQTHREITEEEVRAKVAGAATAKFAEAGATAKVMALHMPTPMYVALSDENAWDVILPDQMSDHATIKVVSTGQESQTLGWVQATLSLETDVYVAKKVIHPSETLSVSDFEVRKADILGAEAGGQSIYRKGQFPDGVRARQTILVGSPLVATAIERVPMVRLGDTVTLILRSDNLKISTKAVVQGSASVGDMVTVQLSRYNRTFRGRLLEGRTVEVWL